MGVIKRRHKDIGFKAEQVKRRIIGEKIRISNETAKRRSKAGSYTATMERHSQTKSNDRKCYRVIRHRE